MFLREMVKIEYAAARRMRTRNKLHYRLAHWPIWIWVFFIAPGPLTFRLFAHGPGFANFIWLLVVLAATGLAGLAGRLPGVEPQPYILRFTEDRPNPLYRKVCYTFAWNAVLNFALLNLLGLIVAVATGKWYLRQIYSRLYFPLLLAILALGLLGVLPRVKTSTKGEGTERRYFYGSVWAVTIAQICLLILWKTLPHTRWADELKLAVYVTALVIAGTAAVFGLLPRTRQIIPGELMVAD